jgi:cytochrome c-type biogenesis protein CcmE
MTRKQRRLALLGFCALGIATAAGLSAVAFRDTLVFFYSPSDLAANDPPPPGRMFRLGGMVEKGSVHHAGDTVDFTVTDFKATLPVTYTGILPDLFREGQGVVAEGDFGPDKVFHATTILAKHDERYMPPEVAKALGKPGDMHHQTDTLVGGKGGNL